MNHQHSLVCKETFDTQLMDEFLRKPFKLYRRRWLILFIYVVYTVINTCQTFEYSIIAHLVMKYYGISSVQVDWTSLIYMVLYMPLAIPASYIMDKKGLRYIALIGAIGTALGTTVKIFSIQKSYVWLIYVGQFILASLVVFIQPLPPRIASVWFGPDQVSLACGLGIFGTFLGYTSGLILAPSFIHDHENVEDIGKEIGYLSYSLAGVSVMIAVIVFFYFPNEPPTPPSINQALERQKRKNRHRMEFWVCLKRMFMDWAFVAHITAYGATVGVFNAFLAIFSQIFITYRPESGDEVGYIMVGVFCFGSMAFVIFGFVLDRYHKYYETTVVLCFLIVLSLLVYIYALESGTTALIYITMAAAGLLFNSYMLAAYELTIELTYPESEFTTTGMLIAAGQTSGALITLLLEYLIQLNILYGLFTFPAVCFICAVISATLPNRLRRQNYVEAN